MPSNTSAPDSPRSMRLGWARAYARGRITQAEFDRQMDNLDKREEHERRMAADDDEDEEVSQRILDT